MNRHRFLTEEPRTVKERKRQEKRKKEMEELMFATAKAIAKKERAVAIDQSMAMKLVKEKKSPKNLWREVWQNKKG